MKKVYLVVNHAVQDCSDFGIGTLCFDSYEKAQRVFREIVNDEKCAITDLDWVIGTDTEDEFVAYEDGYYSGNHTMVEIRDIVIE